MSIQLNIDKFEEYISQFPIYEYRILETEGIHVRERVRTTVSYTHLTLPTT